ncbi:putative bifunctional diguanylate cyclase/phosphodiesterase [Sphingomonas rubra]|uniref:PAS domain S-box-containing protein/diguanylate cyclase (GGDEF) domain-containing protein n=1 Tax=Sphingomonas rubra TaxID=634430 RepID=A0A1I5SQZ9_9SPHN|nr:EAL domain-containing protein [Sphingomonas rubra]SFP73222.1 PAS domain S-box-containing protein/diguanylate cyclase (GGDEF) domain-containing protein [Sphingomonas rubra]
MSTQPSPSRVAVDLGPLLALREGTDPAEWSRIRATQLAAGRQAAPLLFAANLAGGVAMLLLTLGIVPVWQIAGWLAILAAVAATVAVRRLRTHHRSDGYAEIEAVRRTAWEGAALGAAWAIVPLFFCPHLPAGIDAGAGMVLAVLTVAAAFSLAPLVLATIGFLAVLGLAAAGQQVLDGHGAAAAGVALFTLGQAAICVTRARGLVVLRAAEIALEERDETVSLLLREFEDHTADWLWETDAARRVVKASPRFAVACGLDPVGINGMSLLQILAGPSWDSGRFAPGLRALAEKLKARESFRDLRLPVIIDGQERWWELAASPRYGEGGQFAGFRGVGSDVTEQRASSDKIARLARYDTLTELPNRLLINESLARAMADAERWGSRSAFMLIDLDRFKAVNDTLGHLVGDRLLVRVAERLAQLMGEGSMCGRLGGDEFAVVVSDASDPNLVERQAHRIIETLSRPYEVDGNTLHIGASVGLAIGPRDGRTAEMLIRSADLALYRSKDAGGGVFHAYEPKLHAEAEERRLLEMALRTALERGELHLAYQPVVDAGTGQLTGFEALLRWHSAEFGNVSPAKFIPLAEEARLIAPIGAWVVRTACAEAARWPGHVRVAVNVSPDQLQDAGFVTTVTQALATTGLPAERLELEVTESVFMHEGTGAVRVLERLLDLGVRLSLDDFGTGYSSLGYLSRTRFSSIKIDRSFVQAAAKGEREALAIIRAVVALARSLGMATTAEGVETQAEHRMVEELGCTKVQGYFFGRPLPVEEARALANRRIAHAA